MGDKMITILSLIIGILGFVATLIGTYFTYISFVNPITRLKKYLRNPKDWEKFQGIEMHLSIFRHKKYPNFQIIIDWDKPVIKNYQEEWIEYYPDRKHNASYFVRLEANGMLLDKELFVSLDGSRYFVPAPRISVLETKNGERDFYYDAHQIQLANIIGKYYFEGESIYDFAKNKNRLRLIEIRA
ncbi:hypothetical protein M1615_04055 [Patescibacteria group bacterium]|nr:hypothetical protein [Patescibacteria group bacterium]